GLPKTIGIHGDKGTAVIEQDDILKWDFLEPIAHDNDVKTRFAQKVGASGGSSNPAAISHQGHTRQLTDFVNAIKLGGKPLVDGKEGRRAVELIQAIYASNATGKVIHIK
ncbi:gfo/Idh/MocA family oxidoreductase, partial [bacterium]|nr:gfo/Idh/MocA family oxidoreductase [bacterium]